jgi:hypothetical protein
VADCVKEVGALAIRDGSKSQARGLAGAQAGFRAGGRISFASFRRFWAVAARRNKDGTNEGARVAAAVALLDRGWGKPAQMHTGEDGGDIRITIRKIFEHRDEGEPLLLEHEPLGK